MAGFAAPLMLLPGLVLATSFDVRSLGERAAASDRVVLAQVLDSRVEAPENDPARMVTVTRVLVREQYKGRGETAVEVVQLGGKKGLWESRVPGDATFVPGETAVLFLRCRDPKVPARCALNGLRLGRLQVVQGAGGQEVVVPTASAVEPTRRRLEAVVDEIRAGARAPPAGPAGGAEVKR